jgi:hypothetical protein
MAKGVNSLKMELFDAVVRLEPGLTEFDHALDQSGQTVIHRRLVPLILDGGGKQEPFFPQRRFVHIHQDPPFLGSFLATFEVSRNIFVMAVVMQREPDFAIDDFGISRGGVIIPEQTGVWRDSKLIFA